MFGIFSPCSFRLVINRAATLSSVLVPVPRLHFSLDRFSLLAGMLFPFFWLILPASDQEPIDTHALSSLRPLFCIPGWNCTSRMSTPILLSIMPAYLLLSFVRVPLFLVQHKTVVNRSFLLFHHFRHSYLRPLTLPLPDDTCQILDSTLDFSNRCIPSLHELSPNFCTVANSKHPILLLWVLLMSRPSKLRSRSSSPLWSYNSSMSLFFRSDSVSAVAKFHLYQTSLTYDLRCLHLVRPFACESDVCTVQPLAEFLDGAFHECERLAVQAWRVLLAGRGGPSFLRESC